MGRFETLEEREQELRALLDRFPDAGVIALNEHGMFVDLPPSLGVGDRRRLQGTFAFDVVCEADWPTIAHGWQRIQTEGDASLAVHQPDGSPATMYALDFRDPHGVFFIMLTDTDAGGSALQPLPELEPVPRRVASLRLDGAGVPLEIDGAGVEMFGWTIDDLRSREPLSFIHPDDHAQAVACWIETLSSPGRPRRYRRRFRCRDGSLMWIETTNVNRLDDTDHGDVLQESVDISNEVAIQEALEAREELLRELTEALPLGVVQIDAAGRVVHTNDRLFDVVGNRGATTIFDQFGGVLNEDRVRLRLGVETVLRRGESQDLKLRLRRSPDAEVQVCTVTMRPLRKGGGEITGAVACVDDITESSRMHEELKVRATFDTLTGTYNRASILLALEAAIDDPAHAGTGTAAIFLDLDGFKEVNDRFGHAAGDQMLVTLSERLRREVRDHDSLGRLGGDEFLVVCPRIGGPDEAMAVARRCVEQAAVKVELAGGVVSPRVSVGVGWAPNGEIRAELLIARADLAMYDSKRRGVDAPVMWTPELGATTFRG